MSNRCTQAAKTQVAINKGISPRRKNKRLVFSHLILKIPYCDVVIAIALVGIRTGQILQEKAPYKQSINSVDGILWCHQTNQLALWQDVYMVLYNFVWFWKLNVEFFENFSQWPLATSEIMNKSYFRIWSSLPWSLLWAGFTLQTIFRLSSLFFFTMSLNNVCSFSYSSSHVVNTSKQATMICALKSKEILQIFWLLTFLHPESDQNPFSPDDIHTLSRD